MRLISTMWGQLEAVPMQTLNLTSRVRPCLLMRLSFLDFYLPWIFSLLVDISRSLRIAHLFYIRDIHISFICRTWLSTLPALIAPYFTQKSKSSVKKNYFHLLFSGLGDRPCFYCRRPQFWRCSGKAWWVSNPPYPHYH